MDFIVARLDEMGFVNIRMLKQQRLSPKEAISGVADAKAYVYLKNYDCPVCAMNFQNWAIRTTKIRLCDTDSDLRPFYEPIDLTYYDVTLCPYCGYAAIGKYFHHLQLEKNVLIKEGVTPYFIYKEYPMVYTVETAIERYLVALLNALVKGAKASERAFLCLKLSWLNRDKGDLEQEALFRQYALAGFLTAHETENLPVCGMDEPTILYLIGELSRRAGALEDAALYVGRALASGKVSSRLREKILATREQIRISKEKEALKQPFKDSIKALYATDSL